MANAQKIVDIDIFEFGSDGMPVDPELKSIGMAIRAFIEQQHDRKVYSSISSIAGRLHKFKKSPLVGLVVDTMLASGVLVNENSYLKLRESKRKEGKTSEERQENLDAAVRGIAERVCVGEAARSAVHLLTLRLKKTRTFLAGSFRGDRCLIVPRVIRFTGDVPYVEKAYVIHISDLGLLSYKAGPGAISVEYDGTQPTSVIVDPKRCRRDSYLQELLEQEYINPFSGSYSHFTEVINKELRCALNKFSGDKERFKQLVGEDVSDKAWNSYVKSAGRGRASTGLFRRIMFTHLDIETRRYAMRHPNPYYSLYNWFCPRKPETRLHRRQASDVFPMFSILLPSLEQVIDKGQPLLPELSGLTRLPPSILKKLQGNSWQKMGKSFSLFSTIDSMERLGDFLKEVPPENLPELKEWSSVDELSKRKNRWGYPYPVNFARNCSREWEKYNLRLSHSQWFEAVNDTAEKLATAVNGVLYEGPFVHKTDNKFAERILVEHIFGEHMGVKRMKTFIDEWHSMVTRATAGMQTIRRKVFEGVTYRWEPLFDEVFECAKGRLVWLTDEEMLLEEGIEMKHCVGSFSHRCMVGRSHIASIIGKDGSRSTVEISPEIDRLDVAQHQAYLNHDPKGDVVEVLNAFLASKSPRMWATKVLTEEALKKDVLREAKSADLDNETRLTILRLYNQCLPKSLQNRSLDWWEAEKARAEALIAGVETEDDIFLKQDAA